MVNITLQYLSGFGVFEAHFLIKTSLKNVHMFDWVLDTTLINFFIFKALQSDVKQA